VNTRSSLSVAGVAAALALAGCGNAGNTSTQAAASSPASNATASGNTSTQAAASSPASNATASPSCESQADAWKNSGGASHIGAIVSDLSAIQKAADSVLSAMNTRDDLSSAETALRSAAASLQSDAQTAGAALPPACIPGMRFSYRQALTDFSKTAGDFQNWVSELRSDSDRMALGDAQAGTNAMNAGDVKFDAADAALQTFINSRS
jgi:hypothetical protein